MDDYCYCAFVFKISLFNDRIYVQYMYVDQEKIQKPAEHPNRLRDATHKETVLKDHDEVAESGLGTR